MSERLSHASARSETCPSAERAVAFYSRRHWEWRAKMGAAVTAEMRAGRDHPAGRCPRYLARLWQRKARAARLAFARWFARQPKLAGETWRDLLLTSPTNQALLHIARCETGYLAGGVPNWRHRNSAYVGGLGFAWSTWLHYRYRVRPLPPREGSQATRAEQLAVGRALVRAFGGFSSWPACHRRLGLAG